ncbi:MAG: DNA-processing protein DprA [Bacteroidia bacterium]
MNEIIYQLALGKIEGVGHNLAKNILLQTGSAEEVFKAKRRTLAKLEGLGSIHINGIKQFKDFDQLQELILKTDKLGIQYCSILDEEYPFRLRQISDPPLVLFFKGKGSLSPERSVGIVGTRQMTEYGLENTRKLIEELALVDLTVFSGMAYGVDVCAHRACLNQNIATFGVMAHGLEQIQPRAHTSVASKMLEQGGLISECSIGAIPDKGQFPKRNRIIAGLVDVLLVVESAAKGGSLITAYFANQYNREVMAVPGPLGAEFSIGCNRLIKQHRAHLLESAEDVFKLMNWQDHKKKAVQKSLPLDLSGKELEVLKILGKDKVHLDYLLETTKWPIHQLSALLLELEVKNCISSLPGKRFKRL